MLVAPRNWHGWNLAGFRSTALRCLIQMRVPHVGLELTGNNPFGIQLKNKHIMKKILILGVAVSALALSSARAGDAAALYQQNCAKCHGTDGKGDTRIGKKLGVKDYTDPKVQAALKDEAAVKAIKEGLKDKDGNTLMKPAEGMSDDDIKALVGYMRTFKK